MLKPKEQEFIQYWSKHREQFSSPMSKFVRGLPMALLFSFPILLSVFVVYIFFPDWYTKMSNTGGSVPAVVLAVLLVAFFFAYFRMHFKWEMNEQAFQELQKKQ